MASPLRLEDALETNTGCVRKANEDSAVALTEAGVWLVADGMGGHANGKQASEALVRALAAARIPESFDEACAATAAAIHAANAEIYAQAQALGVQMGSTAVALVVRERQFAAIWAGDSRIYLFREGVFHQLTVDHTQVQEMLDRGWLTPEEAEGHPMGHVLARAIGVRPELELDAVSDEVQPGDIFLLCSDGLHGVLTQAEIVAALGAYGQTAAAPLVAQCLERGAPDNVTVLLVGASERTALSFAAPADTL
ncbi:protein phosphatase 2C domain-containing protein [Novosphingobium sp. Chol11]|uniref:PP2C family protein-serine/threonine phosphatase n=1 Tax=Novosphingobium sp. Chol11 TaxID=1385763 RepID=UPI0025E31C35|nr:protein phosphatase 2C domain-containing protein [Novosphingobium sp. Chol11]